MIGVGTYSPRDTIVCWQPTKPGKEAWVKPYPATMAVDVSISDAQLLEHKKMHYCVCNPLGLQSELISLWVLNVCDFSEQGFEPVTFFLLLPLQQPVVVPYSLEDGMETLPRA